MSDAIEYPKPDNYEQMISFMDTYEDEPDGAYFALAEEQGIHAEDWIALGLYEDWLAEQEEEDSDDE